jgi:uncharacterized cupin superfamily protein
MKLHRHVSETRADGKSHYMISEEIAPIEVQFQPGMQFFRIWGTPDGGAEIGVSAEPTFTPFFPSGHGTRVMIVRFPPNDGTVPPFVMGSDHAVREALRADAESKLPGLFQAHESDVGDPGYHTTETLDFVFVLEGELYLEQDGGETVRLEAGHFVVQRGTNHKWSNRAPKPAAFAVVLIGAHRRG